MLYWGVPKLLLIYFSRFKNKRISALDDEFKPHSDEGSSEDEVSSGVDEDKISEPETESEIDSPVKVWMVPFLSNQTKQYFLIKIDIFTTGRLFVLSTKNPQVKKILNILLLFFLKTVS